LAFWISAAGMDDGSGAPLTSSTMIHMNAFRLARGDYPKRAAVAFPRPSYPSRVNCHLWPVRKVGVCLLWKMSSRAILLLGSY
jgi:hypothetical protein